MDKPTSEWMSCGEAERWVNGVTVGNKEHSQAFITLLNLVLYGYIRAKAEKSHFRFHHAGEILGEWLEFDIFNESPADMFIRFFILLIETYGSEIPNLIICSFATGDFRITWKPKVFSDSTKDSITSFSVFGLQFSREGVMRHFGANPMVVKTAAELETEPTIISRRGRTKSSGSFERLDRPLLDIMRDMLKSGQATSPDDAAGKLAGQAYGNSTIESKKTRLAKRYRAVFGESERSDTL